MVNMIKLQLGKNGLTADFMENLKKSFINVEHVRINMLKSATRDRNEAKKLAEEISSKLGPKFSYKLIGYTIVLRKWRKAREGREA